MLIVLAGCLGPDLDGTWTGTRPYKAGITESDAIAATLARVKLTIRGSSYDLVDEGLPRSGEIASKEGGYVLWAFDVAEHTQKAREDGRLRLLGKDSMEFTGPGLDKTPVRLTRASRGG